MTSHGDLVEAEIHHFDGTNNRLLDCDGEPMLGWYWRLTMGLMGPYGTSGEAEEACQLAFDNGDD